MSSAAELESIARQLYSSGPLLMRKMMQFRIRICPFERLIPHIPAAARILDVGCGAGLLLALAAARVPGLSGVGFDSSGIAIETALSMNEGFRLHYPDSTLEFYRLDVNDAWPTGPFDVVTLVDVLHHVPAEHQRTVFASAANHVKPGGLFMYKDMSGDLAFPAAMNRLHDLLLARQWIQYVPIRQAEVWASELGLICEHSEEIRRFWYQHELRVFRRP